MLVVVVLLATVLLRAAIVLSFVYLILPKKRICPLCGAPLARVRHSLLQRLLPMVEHRWCLECGWSGIVTSSASATGQQEDRSPHPRHAP
jgi:hypothetical protein